MPAGPPSGHVHWQSGLVNRSRRPSDSRSLLAAVAAPASPIPRREALWLCPALAPEISVCCRRPMERVRVELELLPRYGNLLLPARVRAGPQTREEATIERGEPSLSPALGQNSEAAQGTIHPPAQPQDFHQ